VRLGLLKVSVNNQAATSSANLSVDDLEAALRLLSAEERAGQTDWRKFIAQIVCAISLGIFILTIPIGLLVVWFNPRLGWGLFVAAGIAAIVFIALRNVNPTPSQIRATLGESLSKTTKTAWEKRSEALYLFVALLLLELLIGLVWLIYGLVIIGEVSLPSLALIALSVIIFWALVGIDMYREAKYLSQVSRLRDQLESRLKEVNETGSNEVPFSSEEINLLSQVETRVEMQHVENKVSQVKHERPDEKLYSIAITWEPLKYLAKLEPDAREAIREAWDEFQTDPKPPEAKPTLLRENEFIIRRGQYDIIYLVDDQKHRIDVVKIQEIHPEETPRAS